MASSRPRIGITPDVENDRFQLGRAYARAVARAGGVPLILATTPDAVDVYVDLCDGFILSGGDDPDMGQWGIPMHPEAKPIDPDRQAFEWALLEALAERPERGVLGVCLGMQLMALHAGGVLDQHLPDTLASAADHWGHRAHTVSGDLGAGEVRSHHRQAITAPGRLRVVANAHDGVIEGVRDDDRPYYLGVQWHPERTESAGLGFELIRRLVEACAPVGAEVPWPSGAIFASLGVMQHTTKRARKKSIDAVDVTGRRVLMRVDFNVPQDATGAITDDRRIRAALPSIRSVIDRGGRLILMSHLGRPKGAGVEPAFSLAPAATRLGELLDGVAVRFAGDCIGPEASSAADALADGEVLVLENLRFHAEEKKGDPAFAGQLAALADVYCNDAFGTAHRAHASMLAVPRAMDGAPCVAGFLLARELEYLSETIEAAEESGPAGFVAVLGGAKVSGKIGAIRNLAGRVEKILVGGAMAYTFLRAQGFDTGASLVEEDMLEEARAMLDAAAGGPTSIVLPSDHVCGREIAPGTPVEVFTGSIDEGWSGLDIGPETIADYAGALAAASTIVWNGPMGVFETPPFDAGTRRVAEAIVGATEAGAISVVGGGDSAAAIEVFGLADRFSHVSTGGGASLQMLEGRSFESVAALDDA
ncbi:MAG: phosphoglycerate kinase [Planctomycetes bacterium]|nr:phosphoglycerate kinase [Planctomycetota bacterium]